MTEPPISNYPSPPDNFRLPIVEVESGRYFYRLNRRTNENGQIYPSARFFDRTGYGRWDGLQQGYGILYVGDDFYATYVECHGRDPGCSSITETELESRFIARFVSNRPLRFVQVYGNGLQKLGVDAGITSCPPRDYEFPRTWGRAFHQHPDRIDGICYLSRHDNTRFCYGIFDRVTAEISEEQLWHGSFQPFTGNSLSDDSGRSLILPSNRQHPKIDLDRVLKHYDYELIRTTTLETDRDVVD
jgi:RES domain